MSGALHDLARRRASLAAVVVNWRNAPDTLQCLASLFSASPRPDRVVVIDNGSGDGSIDRFAEWAIEQRVEFEIIDGNPAFARDRHDSEPAPLSRIHWLTLVRLGVNLG